jgi:SHS2 domain-containing protein
VGADRRPAQGALTSAGVFRWVEHTAELELEIEAPTTEAVFEEALAALAELVRDGDGSPTTWKIALEADDLPMLLVDWLQELIYLGETKGFVPERIASLELEESRLDATVEGHAGEPRHLVKAVTLHRLHLRPDDEGGWRARVVLDV